MIKRQILAKIPLFEQLNETSIDALTDVTVTQEFAKRENLFFQGEEGAHLFILVSGLVQLENTTFDGRTTVIKVVRPGEMFAEAILFERSDYPVTAIALETSFVYMIPKTQFLSLLGQRQFNKDFMGALMKKLRYLVKRITYLSSHDVEDRFLQFLAEHYEQAGSIQVNLTKKEVATAIGATPETLSRLLARLRAENRLIWEGNIITRPGGPE